MVTLVEALAARDEAKRIEARLADIETALDEASRAYAEAQRVADAEGADVARLEGKHPLRWWLAMLGRLDERLAREQMEHAEAMVQLDGAARTHERLLNRHTRTADRLLELRSRAGHVAPILAKQHRTEPSADTKAWADARRVAREIEEALDATTAAQETIGPLIRDLQTAGNWGAFDLLAGGMFAAMGKYNAIDRARQASAPVEEALAALRDELDDIGETIGRVEVGTLMGFVDFFIDDIFTDWIVLSRIDDARRQVQDLAIALDALHKDLEHRLASARETESRAAEAVVA